jgi:hypothetical protein
MKIIEAHPLKEFAGFAALQSPYPNVDIVAMDPYTCCNALTCQSLEAFSQWIVKQSPMKQANKVPSQI